MNNLKILESIFCSRSFLQRFYVSPDFFPWKSFYSISTWVGEKQFFSLFTFWNDFLGFDKINFRKDVIICQRDFVKVIIGRKKHKHLFSVYVNNYNVIRSLEKIRQFLVI